MSEPSASHYDTILRATADGRVVPLLGAGVNLCGRPKDVAWQHGRYLPSGAELAAYLAALFDYPEGELLDLLRVCQYVEVTLGSGPLYDKLHELFDADYPPSLLHELLASLPRRLGLAGRRRYQLIMTTNYDDALERAFRAAGEAFDLVWYVAEAENRGKFLHLPPDGEPRLIARPNEYDELSLEERTVILKIHGAIDRLQPERDSFVITEDHYIDYLTRTDMSTLMPVTLAAKLRHEPFPVPRLQHARLEPAGDAAPHLGRAVAEATSRGPSSSTPTRSTRSSGTGAGVDVLDTSLEEYVAGLTAHLARVATSGVG